MLARARRGRSGPSRVGRTRSGYACRSGSSGARTASGAISHFRPHNPSSRAFDGIRQIWLVRDGPQPALRRRRDAAGRRRLPHPPGGRRRSRRRRGADPVRGAGPARVAAAARARANISSRTSSAARSKARTAGRWVSCAGTLWNGAHDVATVDGADGRERMIPLVPDFVLSVDAPARKMRVRWTTGRRRRRCLKTGSAAHHVRDRDACSPRCSTGCSRPP